MKLRALVIHEEVSPGADPDAADVLVQVDAVSEALRTLGYRVSRRVVTRESLGDLVALDCGPRGIVFNLVESVNGEGRYCHLPPLLLETAQAQFTGCGSTAMLITSNKPLSKRIMWASGIPTACWIDQGSIARADEPGRWIVKSVWEHASIGLDPDSVADDLEAARAVMAERRRRLGGEWFAERYVDGREFNISLLDGDGGPELLAIAEMCFLDFAPHEPRIVDYAAKWDTTSRAYDRTRPSFVRSPADDALYDRLGRLAMQCWDVFGLKGYARVDVRVDGSGEPFVLEINANPCLSPGAGFSLASAQRGLSYRTLIQRIVETARNRTTAARVAA